MKKETTAATATMTATGDGGGYCYGYGGRKRWMIFPMVFVVLCIFTVVLIAIDLKITKLSPRRDGGDCSDIVQKAKATAGTNTRITSANGSPSCSAYRHRTDWQRLYCGRSSQSDSNSTAVVVFEDPLPSRHATSPPPFEACFLTSIFGVDITMVDNLWDATRYKRKFPNHGFFMYTNLVDLHVDGWHKVLYFDPKYRRMITQSRYPKWMAWEHEVIRNSCPVVYYVDGVVTPKRTTLGRLRRATRETLSSRDGISTRLHGWNITTEFVEIIRMDKDIATNVEKTKHWLQQQPDYDPSCKLYQNTYFAYNPKNERFQQAAQFLWERYSQELDSWRDQPLWSYTMSKFNMKPILLEKQFFRIESGRYGGRLGTHVYNNDTNSEGQTYYRKMYECCHKDDVDGHDSSTSGGAAGSDGSSSSKNFKARYAWEVCEPITLEDKALLKKEISDYEKSQRFRDKLKEVRGEMKVAAHHASIDHFLKEKVLRPGWSVLELGCAAGAMLQMVQRQYEGGIGEHGAMVGVELVTGWVRFAQNYFANKGIDVFQGDITDFQLPPPYEGMTFDFIMLNDVAEHIQKHRYGCFFQKLRQVTHEGSLVYFHTPNPQTQLVDAEQFFENVLPHHVLVGGMAASNFELVLFQQDVETDCGHDLSASDPSTNGFPKAILGTRCSYNGYTKYYHALFRRVDSKPLFELN